MKKARDINIVRRGSSSLIFQTQSMLNVLKSTSLNVPFNDQGAFNKTLKYHAVSSRETHEKPPNFDDKEINFQCFSRYFLQSVVTRLFALINVIRIFKLISFFSSSSFLNQIITFLAVACAIFMKCDDIQTDCKNETDDVDDADNVDDADVAVDVANAAEKAVVKATATAI